jgi:acetate---CoA ligase (ADP-forming)
MADTLQNFFYPQKILIAGASSKKGSIGYELTATILKYGYKGELFLVNPSSDEILGLRCYKKVEDVPTEIDLAVILVPKQFAEDTIDACLNKSIKSYILITAGFRETGAEGEAAEKKILEKIRSCGGRMVGPNCMGIINTLDEVHLNATFVAEHPLKGRTAFLSQSGALGAAVLNSLRETDIKFAHFISVGNKADISENDLIKYWSDDNNISVITMYLESFADGKGFIDVVSDKTNKPIIILKAGKTAGGMKAASSHTGALGSSDRSVEAVIKQFGLTRTDNLNDLFNTAKGFENFPLPKGNSAAVVTNAGGPAILAVDMLEKCGLKLSKLSEVTVTELRKIVHPEGSVTNPVDLLPGGDATAYRKVVELLIKDDQVDSVMAIFVEPVMVKPVEVVSSIYAVETIKPVLVTTMPLPEFRENYKREYPEGKPVFRNPEDPAVVLKNMLAFRNRRTGDRRLKKNKLKSSELITIKNAFLSQKEVNDIADKYSLPLVKNKFLKYDELKNESEFPVVLKAAGEGIIHKTELKGVVLNIQSREELLMAAERMINNFKQSNLIIDYFNVQPFIKTRFEILAGGFNDPDFGPMVMFGTGGKYVEYYKDVAVKSAYLSDYDIDDMISSTIMGSLLKGVRGESGIDLSGIKKVISSVAQLMLDHEEVNEIDLNPLLVSEDNKLYTVDIRIKTK